MAKLVVLFTLVPLVELYLLLLLGGLLGFWPTVALVLLTALVGAWLAKREGLRVLRQWQQSLSRGQMPEEGVLGGVLLLVGGVLLVTPGVLTDVVGLALLAPVSRGWVARWLRPKIEARLNRGIESGAVTVVDLGAGAVGPGPRHAAVREVIDVEGTEVRRDG
ncbi:MAG: FxsA family protein [Deltaproteobacteria bacterium]|nr:FxsA family protein [Deltaproteobacteria bacterium]MBW2530852.1 FxsA family protein [Deltaproteobacteria bacterium]